MKKFNSGIFRVAMAIAILLTFLSWVGLEASEKVSQFQPVWQVVGSLWTLLRFPIFTLYWHFLSDQNNLILFSLAVFLNCTFYGFIAERIYSLRRKESKLPPVQRL
jgi:hypothetical protein